MAGTAATPPPPSPWSSPSSPTAVLGLLVVAPSCTCTSCVTKLLTPRRSHSHIYPCKLKSVRTRARRGSHAHAREALESYRVGPSAARGLRTARHVPSIIIPSSHGRAPVGHAVPWATHSHACASPTPPRTKHARPAPETRAAAPARPPPAPASLITSRLAQHHHPARLDARRAHEPTTSRRRAGSGASRVEPAVKPAVEPAMERAPRPPPRAHMRRSSSCTLDLRKPPEKTEDDISGENLA